MESNEFRFVLCAGQRCCPVLEQIDEETYQLSDDNGGVVTLTKNELIILKEKLIEIFP
jgi:hypothetical protein